MVHESHRRNLVRKNESFYAQKFGNLEPAYTYEWQHPIEVK